MVGLKVANLNEIKSVYHCSYCSLLLRDAVQLIDCGHRQCQSCLDEQQGEVIICSECREKTLRENLIPDRGFRNDMQTLIITCVLCSWTDKLKNYLNHLNQNHLNSKCHYCNEKFPLATDLFRHEQFICDKVTVSCPLKQNGCEEMIPRVNLLQHYLTGQHQRVLINLIYQYRLGKAHQTTYLTDDHVNEMEKTINILSNGIGPLNDDLQRLRNEYIQCQNELQPFLQKLPILQKSIDENNAFADSIKPYQETLEQDVLSAKQKFDEVRSMSYDGIYIWRISHVQDKITAAQSGTQTWIDSLPFYSSPTGYKMCLRLFLNGDSIARGTHISLFFVLMRSEYDAILHFPFCFKIRFCLYDQTDQHNHITDILKPDVTSKNFQRPQSDMNTAVGRPKFASLEILHRENNPYIRDDTMFIKAMIDFSNIPNDLLSYAFALNPALTTQMQQTMIREEIEKQQRGQ